MSIALEPTVAAASRTEPSNIFHLTRAVAADAAKAGARIRFSIRAAQFGRPSEGGRPQPATRARQTTGSERRSIRRPLIHQLAFWRAPGQLAGWIGPRPPLFRQTPGGGCLSRTLARILLASRTDGGRDNQRAHQRTDRRHSNCSLAASFSASSARLGRIGQISQIGPISLNLARSGSLRRTRRPRRPRRAPSEPRRALSWRRPTNKPLMTFSGQSSAGRRPKRCSVGKVADLRRKLAGQVRSGRQARRHRLMRARLRFRAQLAPTRPNGNIKPASALHPLPRLRLRLRLWPPIRPTDSLAVAAGGFNCATGDRLVRFICWRGSISEAEAEAGAETEPKAEAEKSSHGALESSSLQQIATNHFEPSCASAADSCRSAARHSHSSGASVWPISVPNGARSSQLAAASERAGGVSMTTS